MPLTLCTLHLPLLYEGTCLSSTASGPGLYSLYLMNEYMSLSIVQFYNVGVVILIEQLKKPLFFKAFGLKEKKENFPSER